MVTTERVGTEKYFKEKTVFADSRGMFPKLWIVVKALEAIGEFEAPRMQQTRKVKWVPTPGSVALGAVTAPLATILSPLCFFWPRWIETLANDLYGIFLVDTAQL